MQRLHEFPAVIEVFVEIPARIFDADAGEAIAYYTETPSYDDLPDWLQTTLGGQITEQRFLHESLDPALIKKLRTELDALPMEEKTGLPYASKAQQTVDNAHMRYFIVHLHRLLDPGEQRLFELLSAFAGTRVERLEVMPVLDADARRAQLGHAQLEPVEQPAELLLTDERLDLLDPRGHRVDRVRNQIVEEVKTLRPYVQRRQLNRPLFVLE